MTNKVTSRNFSWEALVQEEWGEAWSKPDWVYEFSNGRRFYEYPRQGVYAITVGDVSFSSATYTVAEDDAAIKITVVRTPGNTSPASTVHYATADGTATAGLDYTAVSGTLSWAEGQTGSQQFSVPILMDSLTESDETFTVHLSIPTGSTLGSIIDATVTIENVTLNPYLDAVLSSAPIALWRLNEDSGTTASDTINGYSGTYSGSYLIGQPSLVPSEPQNHSFNGPSAAISYVDLGTPAGLQLGSPFSVEAVIKRTNENSDNTIYSYYRSPQSSPFPGLILYVSSATGLGGGNKLVIFNGPDGGGFTNLVGAVTIPSGVNTHICVTFLAGVYKMYVNGALDTAHSPVTAPGYSGCSLKIGDIGNAGFSMWGNIQYLAVYDRDLPGSEILVHYQAGAF